jgi:hypothetical protein
VNARVTWWGKKAGTTAITTAALLLTSCSTPWSIQRTELQVDVVASHTERVEVGSGQRVRSSDEGTLVVEQMPFCRERKRDELNVVQAETFRFSDVDSGLQVLPFVIMPTLAAMVPLVTFVAPGSVEADTPTGRAVIGSTVALALVPLVVFGVTAPWGAPDKVVRRPQDKAVAVAWASEPAPCTDAAWQPAAVDVDLAGTLPVESGGRTLRRRVVADATGVVGGDVLAAYAGVADWCGPVAWTASAGDAAPDADPGTTVHIAWQAGSVTSTWMPKPKPTSLATLGALDAEFAVVARRCCAATVARRADETCPAQCTDRFDGASRLACERACRAALVDEVCR